jgi:hypothetical protein
MGNQKHPTVVLLLLPRRDRTWSISPPLEKSGDHIMRKLSIAVLALSVTALGIPVLTRGKSQETSKEEKKPVLMNIKGTVKSDEGKITFVSDEGTKIWDVINPETLKDHVGHHVELNAHVYADKGQVHVMKVTML